MTGVGVGFHVTQEWGGARHDARVEVRQFNTRVGEGTVTSQGGGGTRHETLVGAVV